MADAFLLERPDALEVVETLRRGESTQGFSQHLMADFRVRGWKFSGVLHQDKDMDQTQRPSMHRGSVVVTRMLARYSPDGSEKGTQVTI